MARWLKQSTATTVIAGPAVDKGDAVTPETGLAVGTVDAIGVFKHEATALTDIAGTTTLTHRSDGYYTVGFTTGDTGTLGRLRLVIRDDDVCLPVWEDFEVLPAQVYDSLVGSDRLQVDLREKGDANLGLTTQEKADVNTEADAALQTIGLDHLLSATVAGADVADDSVIAKLAAKGTAADFDTFDNTTDSLEALRNRLASPGLIIGAAVATDGIMLLYEGDDYTSANAITITVTGWGGPDLDGENGIVRFVKKHTDYDQSDTSAAAVELGTAKVTIAQTGTTITVTLAFAAADIAALELSPPNADLHYQYQVIVQDGSKEFTIAVGQAALRKRIDTVPA